MNFEPWRSLPELWKHLGRPGDYRAFCAEVEIGIQAGLYEAAVVRFPGGCQLPVVRIANHGQ